MHRILYEVTAAILDAAIEEEWTHWMMTEHLGEVLEAGAATGRLIRLDDPPHTYVVQYEFASRDALDQYLIQHAPRLRAASVERFPPSKVALFRRTAEILGDEFSGKTH